MSLAVLSHAVPHRFPAQPHRAPSQSRGASHMPCGLCHCHLSGVHAPPCRQGDHLPASQTKTVDTPKESASPFLCAGSFPLQPGNVVTSLQMTNHLGTTHLT
jgi:hypothetical protein